MLGMHPLSWSPHMTKIQSNYGGASAASDGFPQMRDKMLQMLFELLSRSGLGAHDMQTHAYACPGMLLTKAYQKYALEQV